jgi:hypothetical protein
MSGVLLCALGGYWVATGVADSRRTGNGLAVGIAAALLDLVTAAALGAQFQLLLVVSNLGRIAGGTLGGWLASRSRLPRGAVAAE